MSFLKISDHKKRDALVKDYLATKRRVREKDSAEKMGKIYEMDELSRLFQPVTSQTAE